MACARAKGLWCHNMRIGSDHAFGERRSNSTGRKRKRRSHEGASRRCKGAFGSGKGRACPMSCMFAAPLLRHVELAADPEAFGLAVFAAPDCDPALAVDLAVCADREDSVGFGACLFRCLFRFGCGCHNRKPRFPRRPLCCQSSVPLLRHMISFGEHGSQQNPGRTPRRARPHRRSNPDVLTPGCRSTQTPRSATKVAG